MPRARAAIGIFLLAVGSVPFALLSFVWLVFLATSFFTLSAWNSALLLSVAKVVALMALFWFEALHVGRRLFSLYSGKPRLTRKWLLPLASIALAAACIAIWFFSLQDTKALFPAPAFLSPLLAVPFAFLVRGEQ